MWSVDGVEEERISFYVSMVSTGGVDGADGECRR